MDEFRYDTRDLIAFRTIPLFFFYIGFPLAILVPISILIRLQQSDFHINPGEIIASIGLFIVISYMYPWIECSLNLMSKFTVTDEGIELRFFRYWFRDAFIPWDRIGHIYESKASGPNFSSVWIVEAPGVCSWKRFLQSYGDMQIITGFAILSILPSYEALLAVITEKAKKQ